MKKITTDAKVYPFQSEKGYDELCFETSETGEINSELYSLLDTHFSENIDALHFDQRVEIINSWLKDHYLKGYPITRRINTSGCKEKMQIIDPLSKHEVEVINLGSNDYLNLSQHPAIKQAAKDAIDKYGLGSGSSPLAMGSTDLLQILEKKLAKIKGYNNSLVFASGYSANIGVINALLKKNDLLICDVLAHGSIMDGSQNAVNRIFFNHNDIKSLEKYLKRTKNRFRNRWVVIEGLYSMDGDIAPLNKILDLTHFYEAKLMIDDAHGLGVLGKKGYGSLELFNVEGKVDIVTGTLSKSLGCMGGFVAANNEIINYLSLTARSFLLSTASFIPNIAAAIKAIDTLENEPNLINQLHQNVKIFRELLRDKGIEINKENTPIIPIIVGDKRKSLEITYKLFKKGVLVNPVFYPIVPKNKARIRISVTAGMNKTQIIDVVNKIIECL